MPATGCTHTPLNSGSCNDGNICTIGDQCSAGSLRRRPGRPAATTPTSARSTPACPPSAARTPCKPGPCNDGNACTTGDNCSTGSCVGTPLNCSDGNPCTNDVCTAGVCSNPPNTNPCNDGDVCTTGDTCSGGGCVGGPPPNCADTNICTADSCVSGMGCQHTPIVGCADTDGDGKIDTQDECTTITWTSVPTTPPNQHPLKFRGKLIKLSQADGEQKVIMKGLFNAATSTPPINPVLNGVHVYIEDSVGAILSVSLPGGAGCGPDDGWTTAGTAPNLTWKYRNKTGALPPSCTPGSARGIENVQIKDGRMGTQQALQLKVKAKHATLLRDPALPLTRLQWTLALGAQPSPGVASPQAIAGQCAEARYTGNPIPSTGPKPICKPKLKSSLIDIVNCKGR